MQHISTDAVNTERFADACPGRYEDATDVTGSVVALSKLQSGKVHEHLRSDATCNLPYRLPEVARRHQRVCNSACLVSVVEISKPAGLLIQSVSVGAAWSQ